MESCQQHCVELQQQVEFLQAQSDSAFKNLESSNKAVIYELEEKLHREKQDCRELRKQLKASSTNLSKVLLTVKCKALLVLVQDCGILF